MAIEKIKISELTQSNTKGLVIETVYVGGVPTTYAYDLNNIATSVKGATFAGFAQCSPYINYIDPFQGFASTDKFFYVLKGNGVCGFVDPNSTQYTYSQTNYQMTIVSWDGTQYTSEIVADASITGTEVLQPYYVTTGFTSGGGELHYRFDLSRYPICVKTWSEFVTAMESGLQYINIFVVNDITADATDPTTITISDVTETINISGNNVLLILNLVLESLGRSEALTINVDNEITLHPNTYNPILQTGDKGGITFNVDAVTTLNIRGKIDGTFVELENNQSAYVYIYGKILENYNGEHTPNDITGNITLYGTDWSGKADKVSGATSGDLAELDSDGNLVDSGIQASDVQVKVSGATNGDVATLDSDGKVVDSGKQLNDLADDTDVVHKTGAETVTGVKTFSNGVIVGSCTIAYNSNDSCLTFSF